MNRIKCKPGPPQRIFVGDRVDTIEGYLAEVVEYNGSKDIVIKFLDDFEAKVKVQAPNIRNGRIFNPYHKTVNGIGCYGEITEPWAEVKAFHYVWTAMLNRVYKESVLVKHPTYVGCKVVEDWLNFSTFYSWAKCQPGATTSGWELDKDIILKGNKIYGPDTCCFVPSRINSMFTKGEASRGHLPIGVVQRGETSFRAECSNTDSKKRGRLLGACRKTPEEAFFDYKRLKEGLIKQVSETYKGVLDVRVYNALINYQVEITD